MAHTLETRQLGLGYDHHLVVKDLDLAIPTGKVVSIVGANGSGKSTILRGLARVLPPRGGCVLLDGDNIVHQPSRSVAKRVAILPQSPNVPESLTVHELVSLGRFPYRGTFGTSSLKDWKAVDEALEMVHMAEFATRPLGSLSGGQRQRAWIAMALAQQTQFLLLDEPITHLDWSCQMEVLEVLKKLNQTAGKTIVMVLHDLNMAARFSDQIVAIADGRIVVADTPERVMTADILRQVFQIEAIVLRDPRHNCPLCVPYLDIAPEVPPGGQTSEPEAH